VLTSSGQRVAGCGHRRGRHRHEVLHEALVLQLGATLAAAAAEQPGAIRHRSQDERGDEREPLDADGGADVGHATHKKRVHLVASRSGEHGLELVAVLGRVFTRQFRDDQQAAPSSPPALRELGRGTHDGFDHRGHVVIRSSGGDVEQLAFTTREKRSVTVDHSAQHAIARPEVVVERAPVSLAGSASDRDEGCVEDAVLGEHASSSIQEPLSRVGSIRWHAADVTVLCHPVGVTIRAWRVHRYGEPGDALQIDEIEEPSTGPGQIVVRTSATPLNFNEVDGCFGSYRTINPPLPYTLGMEAVGEVIRAGVGSEDWLGKRVVTTAVGAFGAHAQEMLADADMTFDAPAQLDDIQAAAFFFPFHVAHLALVERGHLQPAQTLLVHAGAGGVGSAAIQLGAALGALVIATAGSAEKLDLCRELGADVAINYRTEDIAETVLDATSGRGVDVVCDLVGGDTTLRTFPCVAHSGRYVLAGFSGGIAAEDTGIVPRPLLFGNFDLCGVMLAYRSDPDAVKRASGFNLFARAEGERVHAHLVDLLDGGSIRTVVGRTAPWTELPAELARLASRATVGRTVLDWRT
jgi:NADPH:quinone reductase